MMAHCFRIYSPRTITRTLTKFFNTKSRNSLSKQLRLHRGKSISYSFFSRSFCDVHKQQTINNPNVINVSSKIINSANNIENNSAQIKSSFVAESSTSHEPKLLRISKELWTIPNIITMTRIVSSPFLVYFIANDMKTLALAGCVVGGFSDWLDGYIAKNYDQASVWGGILDPIADKVFIGCLASGLAFQGLLPLPLLGIILGRDVFLMLCATVIRAIERPRGAPFFDMTAKSATFEIVPTKFSKANTALQFILLGASLSHFAWSIPSDIHTLEPLWYLTGATTVLSGLQYMDGSGIKKISIENENITTVDKNKFTWK